MQGANMELLGENPQKLLAQATAQPLPPNALLHLFPTEIQPSLPLLRPNIYMIMSWPLYPFMHTDLALLHSEDP